MPLLTSYRPNFCCQCGERIVRLRWRPWTSRKFCDKCFLSFARAHWLQPSLMIAALVVFGVVIGRGCRSTPPPLVIERPAASSTQHATNAGVTPPAPVNEQIYTCGARTKKGTPCSRRVHGPVRCWQHKGLPAMLPQEKLLVKE